MLTAKNKAYLKSLANPLVANLTIGKGEVDDKIIEMIDKSLEAHELIKIKVLANQGNGLDDIASELNQHLKSETVQIIGRVIVLYRPSKKNLKIVLK